MIPHFDIIKLAADGLLVLSVLIMGFRYLRSTTKAHTTELMILEASLKGLIKDAESAGRSLNDELGKRQRGLEKLLLDIESSEKRIADTAREAIETAGSVELKIKAARAAMEEVTRSAARPARPSAPVTGIPLEEETPEPPSFETVVQRRASSPRQETSVHRSNIYGEPLEEVSSQRMVPAVSPRAEQPRSIPTPRAEPTYARQRLSASIEKETDRSVTVPAEPVATSMRTVFGAAEDMLRAGKEVAVVAAVTQLPIEKVVQMARAIAPHLLEESGDMFIEEQPQVTTGKGTDPRLGVLGAMRRQTQVL